MAYRLPLTAEAFGDALRKGLGRAVQHLRFHGDTEVRVELLEAVTRNLAYDPQSEGTRGVWLADMLDLLPDANRYWAAVKAAYARAAASRVADPWDVAHLAQLLRLRAGRGDAAAAEVLRAGSVDLPLRVLELVGPELLLLDGLEALPALAARFGADVTGEGGWLFAVASETFGSGPVEAILAAAADPRARAYLAANGEADVATPSRRGGWVEFLAELDRKPRRSTSLAFARRATTEELSLLVEAIDAGGPHLELLLHAGRERLPRMPARLVELATGDGPVARAAIAALVQFRTPESLALGRRLVEAGRFNGVRLLGAAGDEEVAGLADRLPAHGSAEILHHIGMDLLDLCEGRGQMVAPVLIWMVETTPCSFCRHSALDRLLALGAVPAELAEEARHDSNSETRALFAQDPSVP
jgi:hypothetical protein